jgi:hypothetical protein
LFGASPETTITYSITGTLGPNLNSGPDCLGLDDQTATATAMVSSTLTPSSTTSNSATYTLPAGAITAVAGGLSFTSTTTWKMVYKLTSKGDSLTLSGEGPFDAVVTANSALVVDSFPKTVLGTSGHPAPLGKSHEPQSLTSPGSYLSYSSTALMCTVTKLGFTGSASSNPK